MLKLLITSETDEKFIVRFQIKKTIEDDGSVTWTDSEVTTEVRQSQLYGLDENFRLVVEAVP